MNKQVKKILSIILIIGIFYFALSIDKNVEAKSTTVSASSKTVSSGETFTVNISSSLKLTGWTISLSSDGGCIFKSASGGEINGSKVYGMSNSPISSLASYTFKAPEVKKDTTYAISFFASELADENTDKVDSTSCTAKITVKPEKTSGESTGSGSGNESESNNNSSSSGSNSGSNNNSSSGNSSNAPSFTSVNETVYATGSVNVRQSWSTSSKVVGSLSEGQSITRTGKGSNGWSRVTFNGSTAYVSSEYLTTEKKEDKSKNSALKQLTLLQGTLTPEFKKDVTEYTVQVGTDVTELQLDAVPEDEKAKVTVEGNTDLKDGENKVTITVMAEDESKTVYTLIVNKTDKTAETGLTLNKLEIAGVTLTPTFTPDVYSYSINVATGTTSVDITAEAGDEDATVEITGNTDLKDGENLITIMVKKGEGDKQQIATYQITVNVGEQETVVTTEKSSGPNILIIICGVAAAIIVISIITLIVINRRNKMDYDDEDDDEDYANTTILNQNFNYADELKAKREEKNEAKKQSREEYLNSYKDTIATNDIDANNENNYEEDDDTTRKKRKGRHF